MNLVKNTIIVRYDSKIKPTAIKYGMATQILVSSYYLNVNDTPKYQIIIDSLLKLGFELKESFNDYRFKHPIGISVSFYSDDIVECGKVVDFTTSEKIENDPQWGFPPALDDFKEAILYVLNGRMDEGFDTWGLDLLFKIPKNIIEKHDKLILT